MNELLIMEGALGAQKIQIRTSEQVEMVCLDALIFAAVTASRVRSGLCVLYVPHTTAALTINENADPNVARDIIMETNRMIPFMDNYRHAEGNSAAHIKSSLFGATLTLLVEEGELVLGTWQSIYFCEFDGPRNRTVFIKIQPDVMSS